MSGFLLFSSKILFRAFLLLLSLSNSCPGTKFKNIQKLKVRGSFHHQLVRLFLVKPTTHTRDRTRHSHHRRIIQILIARSRDVQGLISRSKGSEILPWNPLPNPDNFFRFHQGIASVPHLWVQTRNFQLQLFALAVRSLSTVIRSDRTKLKKSCTLCKEKLPTCNFDLFPANWWLF